jgi:hypothetical protein
VGHANSIEGDIDHLTLCRRAGYEEEAQTIAATSGVCVRVAKWLFLPTIEVDGGPECLVIGTNIDSLTESP